MSKENNPKEELINAIQDFISEHNKEPKKATISRELALDFCKLGMNDLGDLAQELFPRGPDALNGKKLFGVQIIVPQIADDIDFIELE